jgi:hypothetical protein
MQVLLCFYFLLFVGGFISVVINVGTLIEQQQKVPILPDTKV